MQNDFYSKNKEEFNRTSRTLKKNWENNSNLKFPKTKDIEVTQKGIIRPENAEVIEYTPQRCIPNPKVLGIAFHELHKLEMQIIAGKLQYLNSNIKFLHKPCDQINVLISQDSKLTPLVLLALVRDAFIVRPTFAFDSSEKKKIILPETHEVSFFPRKSERPKSLKNSLNNLKLAIDVFAKSSSHAFLGDPIFEQVIAEMGGGLVRRICDSDFIISDKTEKLAASTVFKKVHFMWLADSLLKNVLLPVQDYYF